MPPRKMSSKRGRSRSRTPSPTKQRSNKPKSRSRSPAKSKGARKASGSRSRKTSMRKSSAKGRKTSQSKKAKSSGSRSPSRSKSPKQKQVEDDDDEEGPTLFTAPFDTLFYFVIAAVEWVRDTTAAIISNKYFLFVGLPFLIAYGVSKVTMAELYNPPNCSTSFTGGMLWEFEIYGMEALWWITLGILSSVGFGTGLHSGIMFLFPHLMTVVFAGESCGTFEGMKTMYLHPCKLQCPANSVQTELTFLYIFVRVIGSCMLWGFGTAIGELPPYFVSRAASITAGKKDEDFQKEVEEAEQGNDPFSKMKVWTINFTEKHGFVGVLFLAAWPNAAFDMCGMCCGYLQMPFWTFFIATALGKGVVKVAGQAVFFICLFGSQFFNAILLPVAGGLTTVLRSLSGVLPQAVASMDMADFVSSKRLSVIKNFAKQERFTAVQMGFQAGNENSFISTEQLSKLYHKFDDSNEISQRVLTAWDTNKDGKLQLGEILDLISTTDDKLSLKDLDADAGGVGIIAKLWELFIVGVVVFFFVSIINSMAAQKAKETRMQKKLKNK